MIQNLSRIISLLSITQSISRSLKETHFKDVEITSNSLKSLPISFHSWRNFSNKPSGDSENPSGNEWGNVGSSKDRQKTDLFSGGNGDSWDSVSSWSTGLTKEHFDGSAVGHQVNTGAGEMVSPVPSMSSGEDGNDEVTELEREISKSEEFMDGWDDKMEEVDGLLDQVMEPGARGSYLKDSEKAEMYKLHKENPEVYTIEKLAKDYRVMRQRVHAILWLKEIEEEEEKKLGHPLDDSVELLLDEFPEFFNSHDREFHVASLPYKPDFKVMPEGWDGTTRDPDEVHYEISMKEDEMLYQEFVQRMNFNKKKMAGEVHCHKYSRRRSSNGWNLTVEKLGPSGRRGGGGGWKFVSLPDGSSRELNELEKMYVKRETRKRRRKILP